MRFLIFLQILFLVLVSCDDSQDFQPSPDIIGIGQKSVQIGLISLTPKIEPPASIQEAVEGKGWPEIGQNVFWEAEVLNHYNDSIEIAYSWLIGDVEVLTGTTAVAPGTTILKLPYAWSSSRNAINFNLSYRSTNDDLFEKQMTVYSNALTIGFWVEKELYDWMLTSSDLPSFEEWAYQHVSNWNKLLERDHCEDRLRMDTIGVVDDGQGWDGIEGHTDLTWVFPAQPKGQRFLSLNSPRNVVMDQTILLHELLHQRGLTDLYAYEVLHLTSNGSEVKIKDFNGSPAAGSVRMPLLKKYSGGSGFAVFPLPDFTKSEIMGTAMSYGTANISEHSAYGLNLYKHKKTPWNFDVYGNQVNLLVHYTQDNVGNPYLTYVPEHVALAVTDKDDEKLTDVRVEVFFDKGDHIYQDIYNPDPDFTLDADAAGNFILPTQMWSDESWAKRMEPNTLIIRVSDLEQKTWGYAFIPSYYLNLAKFQGKDTFVLPVKVSLQ